MKNTLLYHLIVSSFLRFLELSDDSHSLFFFFLKYSRYGDLYTEENVAISGIHTHAGPGGYLQYVIYIITSLGFVRQSFDVLVDGIERSIMQAHENLRPGSIFIDKGIPYQLLSFKYFDIFLPLGELICS